MTKADRAYSTRAPDAGRSNNPTVNPEPQSGPPVGDPLSSPTRRAAIGALTGGAFLAAGGAIPATADAKHPDARLLTLYEEFLRLDTEFLRAVEHQSERNEACADREPPLPVSLAYRQSDHAELGFAKPLDSEGGHYQPREIEWLRAKPRRRKTVAYFRVPELERVSSEVAATLPPDRVVDTHFLMLCPIAQARADEIVKAWDEWLAQCDRVAIETGLVAADEAVDAILDVRRACTIEIASTKAHTIDGLRVRAKMIEKIHEGDLSGEEDDGGALDRKLMWATIRDLVAQPIEVAHG